MNRLGKMTAYGAGATLYLAALYFVTNAAASKCFGIESDAEKVCYAVKDRIEAVQDRIETERAIKAEGIQAKSFAEAKAELDKRRLERVCKELGVSVPKKPVNDGTITGLMNQNVYQAKVCNIYLTALLKSFDHAAEAEQNK